MPVTYEVGKKGTRFLANEAVLVMPEPELADICGKRRSFFLRSANHRSLATRKGGYFGLQ